MDFNQVEYPDPWLEIAARLDIKTLGNLTIAWRWFWLNVMAKDTLVWKKRAMEILRMPDPGNVIFNWKDFNLHPDFWNIHDSSQLYETVYNEVSVSKFMACHFFTSDTVVLTGNWTSNCLPTVDRVKRGIWIAEAHADSCHYCTDVNCTETFCVFSLRHFDPTRSVNLPNKIFMEEVVHEVVIRNTIVISIDQVNHTYPQLVDASDRLLEEFAVNRLENFPFYSNRGGMVFASMLDGPSVNAAPCYKIHVRYQVVRDTEGEAVVIFVEHLRLHEDPSPSYEWNSSHNMLTNDEYVL